MKNKIEIIAGDRQLDLIACTNYRISYGIHQGIYEFIGADDADYCKFKNIETGQVSFAFYCLNEPYLSLKIISEI